MKCKKCGRKENVVKYGRGLKYKDHVLPHGYFCHECVRAWKMAIVELDEEDYEREIEYSDR